METKSTTLYQTLVPATGSTATVKSWKHVRRKVKGGVDIEIDRSLNCVINRIEPLAGLYLFYRDKPGTSLQRKAGNQSTETSREPVYRDQPGTSLQTQVRNQ